jgi:small-conductance mechanosensitive channel
MPPQRPPRATPEALQALRERLQATQEAAQKLAEDASRPKPPPAGWDVPRSAERANDELDALIALAASVRDLLPPELREQLADIVKQILVFVRAVLDWWIDRIDREPPAAGGGDGDGDDVEDIPIS